MGKTLPRQNIWQNATVFLTSLSLTCLLIFLTGEILLRVRYGSGPFPETLGGGLPSHLVQPDPVLGYSLTPGFKGKQRVPGSEDVEYQVNEQGLRDYERRFPLKAQIITAIGDSFTFGHGVAFEKTWATLLENKIRSRYPQYDLLKAGVPGFNWRQYAQQYERITQDLTQHPLVIVGFTVDAGDRLKIGYEARGGMLVKRFYPNLVVLDGLVYEKPSRSEWINQTDAFLRSRSYFFRWFNYKFFFLYHQIQKTRHRKNLENQPLHKKPEPHPLPVSQRRHVQEGLAVFERIAERARAKKAKMLVLFIDLPGRWPEEINYYQKALSGKGIWSLDLSKFEEPGWRFSPNGHWNHFGHEQVAEKVYEFIQSHQLLAQ